MNVFKVENKSIKKLNKKRNLFTDRRAFCYNFQEMYLYRTLFTTCGR